MSRSNILAFDTTAAHCAAAIISDGALVHARVEPMAKGQAERILGLCGEVLALAGLRYQDLCAIGVGVGPGNFTGIRISVSAARGLALGLGVPAIPVSTFETLRDPDALEAHETELVIVEAPRGAAYAQMFSKGRPTDKPEIIDPASPPQHFTDENLHVTGFRADDVAAALNATPSPMTQMDPAARLARVADWKWRNAYDMAERPAPLYVRAPDAAPARDKPPTILP